jgi:hypothetical protein
MCFEPSRETTDMVGEFVKRMSGIIENVTTLALCSLDVTSAEAAGRVMRRNGSALLELRLPV